MVFRIHSCCFSRIGGVTRFQGRPTKGEISLIEKRVENMSKGLVESKEQLKAWKQQEVPAEPVDSKSETRNISALDFVTPDEKRQIAEDEAKIFRMKNSFERLPNIDKRTAEILARSITEEERREKEAGSTNELMSMSQQFKNEARRGKMPRGTLYKSNLTQKDKSKDSSDSKGDQFGLGRVNPPNPPTHKKQVRRTVRMKPVFPVKEKTSSSTFEAKDDIKTPNYGKMPLQKDELGVDNKTFITQPRENSSLMIGSEDATESMTRANSGKKSVKFEESTNKVENPGKEESLADNVKSEINNPDETSKPDDVIETKNLPENSENQESKETIEANDAEEQLSEPTTSREVSDVEEIPLTDKDPSSQVFPEEGLQTIEESPTE